MNDHQLAAETATAAGRMLVALRAAHPCDATLGATADAAADQLIAHLLHQVRPGDALLSEERAPDLARLNHSRVWIIDPLDGTREYAETGQRRSDWAVHVALTIAGRPAACAVALPALDLTFGTHDLPMLPPAPPEPLKILVSRTRAPEIARRLANLLGAELVPMGSAGAKAMAVLRGEAHAYVHAGGQHEWDSCAPVGVALAAGLHASRLDGSTCLYNQADTSMPDLLVCRPECAAPLLSALRGLLEAC